MFVVLKLGVLVRVLAGVAVGGFLVFLVLGGLRAGAADPPGTTTAPNPAAGGSDLLARTAPTPYVVSGTGSGLNVRSCAASTCRRVGWIAEGGTFAAECWTHGTPASGDDRWLRGTAGGSTGYAAAHFLRGSGAPECGTSPARRT
ncbi:hypothetical protein [Amycolatopsis sp. CA-128772]|uniref:hypothetical protein n=1 Tax=Amycolatopsis sp. CA-128772 TaxID=2073159 RepID=UPI000CD05100|nr:hypothetical protein [Amycolatopsis sp. CA-128772]